MIVTAEHRQTRLQKVPVAVSVFTGASRDAIGITTVQDVTNFAPGFVYDPANVHAYIRGVGRQSINLTDDARVATYEDEFYVYSPYGLDKSSLFLSQEQIERGPQNVGGRNAAAGSIDMISVRPTDQPYAEVRATVGNYRPLRGRRRRLRPGRSGPRPASGRLRQQPGRGLSEEPRQRPYRGRRDPRMVHRGPGRL